MKKLDAIQMEKIQGGRCWRVSIFGFTLFRGGSNAGEGEPVWVESGLGEGHWEASPNTCRR